MQSSGPSKGETVRDASSHRRSIQIGVIAAVVAAGVFAIVLMRQASEQQEQIQLWPSGNVQDIEDLANREDVNVLFLLIDTLRADRMSAYGY